MWPACFEPRPSNEPSSHKLLFKKGELDRGFRIICGFRGFMYNMRVTDMWDSRELLKGACIRVFLSRVLTIAPTKTGPLLRCGNVLSSQEPAQAAGAAKVWRVVHNQRTKEWQKQRRIPR